MQQLLERNPSLLVQVLGGGHGRWVLPQQRLGSEHVTDFLIAERDSAGMHWTAVELESPSARMFTKAGDYSARLAHAVRQIQDWRAWLAANGGYARRWPDQGGLGLWGIQADLPGIIIIGRRAHITAGTNHLRREIWTRLGIRVRSYDSLIDAAKRGVQLAASVRKQRSRWTDLKHRH